MISYFSRLKKQNTGLFSLLFKILVFTALFILVTGITGPWIISTPLLYDFSFFIYGNLGKLVIFSIIIFTLMTRGRLKELKVMNYEFTNILYIILGFSLIPVFFYLGNELLRYKSVTDNIPLTLLAHLSLVLIPLFILVGVFEPRFILKNLKIFKKEIIICAVLSVALFFAIFQIWKLWPFFSGIVLTVQYFIFSSFLDKVNIIPPMTLFVERFAVEIGEACSGLESIFLFTVLYIFIAVMDYRKLDLKKVILFYPPLLAGLFIVNIIRVFLLILIGLLISPRVMAALFHTYLGMILFIIYFLIFLKFIYKRLKK